MNAIATTREADPATLRDLLAQAKASIELVLPQHLNADRMIKVALVAASASPQLQKCSAHSVLQAVMQASELGLEVGSALGLAYLVPYGKKCTLIVGYRGLIELARRSGELRSIESHPVYEGESFALEYGLEPRLEHKPDLRSVHTADELIGCYVIARLRDGGTHVEWMSRGEIEAIRMRSRASKDGPWVTDYVEMCRKTVLRRACKYLPISAQLARAFEVDGDYGPPTPAVAGTFASPPLDGRRPFDFAPSAKDPPTTSEPAAVAPDAGDDDHDVVAARFAVLCQLAAESAGVSDDEGESLAAEWLKHKWKRERLADSEVWKLILGKAQKHEWKGIAA